MRAHHEIGDVLKLHHIEYKLKLADRKTPIGYGSTAHKIMHDDVPHANSLYRFYVKKQDLEHASLLIKDINLIDR